MFCRQCKKPTTDKLYYQGKKSYYLFRYWSFIDTLTGKQTSVMNRNQETFDNSVGIPLQWGSAYAYIYAPYSSITFDTAYGEIKLEGWVNGRDHRRNFQATNVNTVLVARDCKTVLTSYPGLPGGISPSDPRISGKPTWWPWWTPNLKYRF